MMFLIGFLLPALIGLVTRFIKDSDGRFWASSFICAIFGIGYNYLEMNGSYSGLTMMEIADTLAQSVMAMIGLVKLSYELFWNNQSIGKALTSGEKSPLEGLNLKNDTK